MLHVPIKFKLRSDILLQNRTNLCFITKTILHEFLLSFNSLVL
uniref:Uncharacterized protein n=2 Tax=unclassified Caudoviricetes TaxID=2788787 RepID=A0A8S5PJS8_9CAUD|nr:MAG TPA: hypothetical protein [Siphoviridae sp. ctJcm18]DAE06665.1 MAG TPA: hypothetical protein [Siphoviridae sp. ctUGQ45]